MDHDLVATADNADGERFPIAMREGKQSATMTLARLAVEHVDGVCRVPVTVNTPQLDAGPVYGHDERYLKARSRARSPLWPLTVGSRWIPEDKVRYAGIQPWSLRAGGRARADGLPP
jgi:hypothetical protein